jgi:hypothetical protein
MVVGTCWPAATDERSEERREDRKSMAERSEAVYR